MAAVEHSAVHPVGVQMLLGDRYPGCAARPWATMFNRVAVVVRAIAKFWNLELGTWNLELGTWNLEPALGLTGEASAGLYPVVRLRVEWDAANGEPVDGKVIMLYRRPDSTEVSSSNLRRHS